MATVTRSVRAFLSAEQTCFHLGQTSECLALVGDTAKNRCFLRCVDARETFAHSAASAEQAACESRYVQASGRGQIACSLPGASSAVDTATISQHLKQALSAADPGKIDVAIQESDAAFAFVLQKECTKKCLERGGDLLSVARQGPALIASYKRCMVAADSTPEARKLNAYETDLYCDYLAKAATRCRAAGRCDWVEKFSDQECSYVSPGVGVCNR
jgi:hypothetical protein